MNSDITELCDYLAHYVNPEYRWLRFSECIYREKEDVLTSTFLFDERLNDRINGERKIDILKPRLEEDFRNAAIEHMGSCGLRYRFIYRQSYLDKTTLDMKVRQFLTGEFSILTLNLSDNDVQIACDDTREIFTLNLFLKKQASEHIQKSKAFEKFLSALHESYFCTINVFFNEKETDPTEDETDIFSALEQYVTSSLPSDSGLRIDKTMKVRNIEYYLGKPVQERPIRAEFLKASGDEQVIAGTISYLTKREYKRTGRDGSEEMRTYFTFVLDDGKDRTQCVFFPTSNSLSKFEKLVNGTVICAAGVNSERNGRVSFRVLGISFCELA